MARFEPSSGLSRVRVGLCLVHVSNRQESGNKAKDRTTCVARHGSQGLPFWARFIDPWSGNTSNNRPIVSAILQEIEIIGYFNIDIPPWPIRAPITLLPPTLTSIRLRGDTQDKFDIGWILEGCPLLESLVIGQQSLWAIHEAGTSPVVRPPPHQDRLPLRMLVLRFACLSQEWLHSLLDVVPHLQDLRLIELAHFRGWDWDTNRLFQHLRRLSQPLLSFHFSLYNEFPSHVVQILIEQQSVLTTLDILWLTFPKCHEDGWRIELNENIRAYSSKPLFCLLCNTPSLRHLRTLKTPYLVEHMDIHHRTTMVHSNPTLDNAREKQWELFPQQGIWVCRNLEILRLQVHGHGPYFSSSLARNRVLYGYISAVCPRLVELKLETTIICSTDIRTITGTHFTGELSSGLCLLSRLRFLERPCVVIGGRGQLEPAVLNWFYDSGRTVESRKRRRAIVDSWSSDLQKEAELEVERLSALTDDSDGGGGYDLLAEPGFEDAQLMDQLRNLGLLLDVKNMVEDMV
ncbi:hypothetical protein BGX33_011146 [Mortierella sp. NVP41]|nr:hypothetical protein BGX33_011146 [Mortierella sp. NVP41]